MRGRKKCCIKAYKIWAQESRLANKRLHEIQRSKTWHIKKLLVTAPQSARPRGSVEICYSCILETVLQWHSEHKKVPITIHVLTKHDNYISEKEKLRWEQDWNFYFQARSGYEENLGKNIY